MENKIIVNFGDDMGFVELKTNTPNLDTLIGFVIRNKSKIKVNKIDVTCTNAEFDSKGFAEILIKSISDFLDKLTINKELFDNAIKDLTNK